MKTGLFIPDCHIPFESKAYDIMLTIAATIELEYVVILGDYLDLYGLSFYAKNPELGDCADLFDREIDCANFRLDQIDKLFPKARKVFLEGNHEARMKKFIAANAPALRNRIKIIDELNIPQRPRWTWVPFTKTQYWQFCETDLFARHCPPVGGSAKNVAKQSGHSVIYGHTHQLDVGTHVKKASGQLIYALNGGWLGNEDELVFDYVPTRTDWSKHFYFVHAIGKDFWPELVSFHDGKAIFRGKVFK